MPRHGFRPFGRPIADRPAIPPVRGALTLFGIALCALTASACQAIDIIPEDTDTWARAELVPTYTPLPPSTATMTPLPSATATLEFATPTLTVFQAAGVPVRLEIPAIGVDTTIEKVGRDALGRVDVPKISANVAWFTESALPGENGKTSVISGHLDDPYGPAVFYQLRELVPGDEIAVTYSNGDRHVFVVEDKERYAFDAAPSQKIFGTTPQRMMNLITCDGAWDAGGANYDQRLVVYTRLVEGVERDG